MFSIKIGNKLQEIISKFDDDLYIFPVLTSFHKTPTQKANRIKKCIKKTNLDLKEIGMRIGIDPDITTYTARHTYAMRLKRNGINLGIISDAMGHADSQVTRAYLSRFEDDRIDETDDVL
jgi:integrase